MSRGPTAAALLLTLLTLPGCDALEFEGWLNQPIPIRTSQDIPLIEVRYADRRAVAAIDTGAPLIALTLEGTSARHRLEVRLQDGQRPEVTRFIFRGLETYDLPLQPAGLDTPIPLEALLGSSLLRYFAVHLSYLSLPSLTLKDEIPDTNAELASDCESPGAPSCLAVFSTPRLGGGLTRIGEEEVNLPGTRLALPLCLLPRPFDPDKPREGTAEVPSGVPVMAVIGTGQGTSLISRSALERLRAAGEAVAEGPGHTLYLPSGAVTTSIIQLDRIAAVSNETIELAPCGELARRRRQLLAPTIGLREDDRDQHGASVASLAHPVTFAVLEDQHPYLQGLRHELNPYVAEVDVVLGGSFLRFFEVDLDYPANRLILKCAELAPAGSCAIYPSCSADDVPRCPTSETP